MIFRDITLVEGRISTLHTVDTRELAAWAVGHCLISCVLPAEGITPDLILVAADFSKCFAAALLTEVR